MTRERFNEILTTLILLLQDSDIQDELIQSSNRPGICVLIHVLYGDKEYEKMKDLLQHVKPKRARLNDYWWPRFLSAKKSSNTSISFEQYTKPRLKALAIIEAIVNRNPNLLIYKA